ncbi:MAG: hypothetical protein Q4E65_07735 [Clostridia bacterium]|nr:hypothetical protein [Clostridia bacterium]
MMNEFFTWSMLGTYAGAVLATTLTTQLLKGIPLFDKLPTRVFSYFVAVLLLLAAAAFTEGLTFSAAALSLINAVVVALAANGAFDAVQCTGEYCKTHFGGGE